nr:cytochrome b5 domain-containing protein [Vaginisenegalia massiliensis]
MLIEEVQLTPKELAEKDGREGRPAYVAIDGVVYDVSLVFKLGMHHGVKAGQDVTDKFVKSNHGREILQKMKVVASLKSEK